MPKFASYSRSDIGKVRTNNEDFCGAVEPQDRRALRQSGRLYVVADGMGGHAQGEKASTFAVQTLLKAYYREPKVPPEKRLRDSIQQINQNLIAYTKENLQPGEKTGTTLVAALIRRDRLWVANVGDSRAYLLREGRIRQLTRDHSLVAELVRAGTISKEEAAQSKHRNVLSRSVGVDPNLEVDIYPAIPLQDGDLLLLCTDGLIQYATPQEILQAAHGSPREIVERLILLANERGGADNITVSAVRYAKEPSFPFARSWKALTLFVAGLLVVVSLALLAWFGLSRRIKVSAVLTGTSLPLATASLAQMILPETIGTPLPGPGAPEQPTLQSPTPSATPGLVDCEYTVVAGDTAGEIAERFDVPLDRVYRQDGTRENMSAIDLGEILVIRDVSSQACTDGGGALPAGPAVAP